MERGATEPSPVGKGIDLRGTERAGGSGEGVQLGIVEP